MDLAAELGYLPLALEQGGAYIAEQRITVAKYLTLLRERPAETFAGWTRAARHHAPSPASGTSP